MNQPISSQSQVNYLNPGSPVFTRVFPWTLPQMKGNFKYKDIEYNSPPGSIQETMSHHPLEPLIKHSRSSASAFKYCSFGGSGSEESSPKKMKKQIVFTIQPAEELEVSSENAQSDYTVVQPFYYNPEYCKNVELTGAAFNTKSKIKKPDFTKLANVARDIIEEDADLGIPSIEDLPKVPGYEHVTFEPTIVFPTCLEEEDFKRTTSTKQSVSALSIPQLTEEEARQALMDHVTTRCTYVRSVARDMTIRKIESSPGYQYALESFTEMRQVAWTFEPYTGDFSDERSSSPASPTEPVAIAPEFKALLDPSPTDSAVQESSLQNAVPPSAWEISCPCPSYFQNHVAVTEVPHTSSVKTCHLCGGVGRRRCTSCNTSGWENCYYCHGDGQKVSLQGQRDRCYSCLGTGRKKCWKCNGEGMAACRSCGGTGQVRCYINVTVTWTNHVDEHVEDPVTLMGEKLESVSGHLVFEEQMHQIPCLKGFPEKKILEASQKLLEKSRMALGSERLLMQRHRVRLIPVSSVTYQWNNHVGLYYVYGAEKKVYAPDYPQASCCALI